MPSEDTFHEERPETNSSLGDGSGTSRKTYRMPRGFFPGSAGASAAPRTPARPQAAKVQALAAQVGVDAEELAAKIPADTLRRLKFSVIESTDSDGRSTFKHDLGIVQDKRTSLLATDRAHDSIPQGSHGRGAGTPQPRSSSGKFSK